MAEKINATAEEIPLKDHAKHIFEVSRIILPGIQTIFGFQLIAVLNTSFFERLSFWEQRIHLLATILMVVAIILAIAPAAYDRINHPHHVTERFVQVCTKFLTASLIALIAGITLDMYLIIELIIDNWQVSLIISIALLLFAYFVWFWIPRRDGGMTE
jgi:hypothetical protein